MIIIIVIITDHYPSSRVSLFKMFFASGGEGGINPPNQNPADPPVWNSFPDSIRSCDTNNNIIIIMENELILITVVRKTLKIFE